MDVLYGIWGDDFCTFAHLSHDVASARAKRIAARYLVGRIAIHVDMADYV